MRRGSLGGPNSGARGCAGRDLDAADPDGHGRVELAKFHSPQTPGANQDAAANTPGIRHIAFAVEDIDAVLAGLRARGAELVGELERYEDSYRLCLRPRPRRDLYRAGRRDRLTSWVADPTCGSGGRRGKTGPTGKWVAGPRESRERARRWYHLVALALGSFLLASAGGLDRHLLGQGLAVLGSVFDRRSPRGAGRDCGCWPDSRALRRRG